MFKLQWKALFHSQNLMKNMKIKSKETQEMGDLVSLVFSIQDDNLHLKG